MERRTTGHFSWVQTDHSGANAHFYHTGASAHATSSDMTVEANFVTGGPKCLEWLYKRTPPIARSQAEGEARARYRRDRPACFFRSARVSSGIERGGGALPTMMSSNMKTATTAW